MQTLSFHTPFTGVRVDENTCTIPGVSLISRGEAEGHSLIVDSTTLQQIFDSAVKAGQLPVKINHGSGVENLCGYLDNFRLEANNVRGDWHLLKSHDETAKLLERAQVMPKLFGLSVAFAGSGVDIGGGKKAARCQSLKAVDCVASPAANVNGLFSAVDPRPRNALGMFDGGTTGAADPAGMAAAYGGVAERKQSRLARIAAALRKNQPVQPQTAPELASLENLIRLENRMDSILNLAERDKGTLRRMVDAGLVTGGVIGGTLIGSKLGIRAAQVATYRKAKAGENLVGRVVGIQSVKHKGIVHVGVADSAGNVIHSAPGHGLQTDSRKSFIGDHQVLVERGNARANPKDIRKNSQCIGDWSATANCEHAATRITGRKPRSRQLQGILAGAGIGAIGGGVATDRATKQFAAIPSSLDAATARADANKNAQALQKDAEKKRKELADRFIRSQQSKEAAKASADDLSGFYKNNTFAIPEPTQRKRLNPYLGAAISGGLSGAALGFVPILKNGVKLKTALKSAASMGALSAGIVGGGSLIGSKIIGAPKEGENSPFLKRAALGGAIAGTGMGIAGAVLAKKNPFVKGAIASLAKEWRPAAAMQKAGVIKASAIGALAGGGYGAMTGSDEGSQVDTIQSLRKDRQKTARRFARVGTLTQFASQLVSSENGIPLTGKLAKDRFIKKLRDEDLNKRDANILRTGAVGAIAGSLLGGKAGLAKRALLGAGAGALGVIGARAITSQTRDVYGERSRGGKQAEKFLPIGAAATLAAAGIKKKLTGKFFSSAVTAAIQLSNRLEKLNTL